MRFILGLFLLAVLSLQAHATGYYLSPTGVDTAAGTSSAPWLSPSGHNLTCGDTITAAVGSYSAANFASGKWSTVSCAGNNNVVWLQCATFDGCKIASSTTFGMEISASYWGVLGWEITTTGSGFGTCLAAAPPSTLTIHHIIFADNVLNGCQGGGVTTFNNGTASVDYFTAVANIAYNAAQGNTHCFSGFSVFQPVASDAVSGTHLYIAGNFAYANRAPSSCNGGGSAATDADGIILDTFDGSQTSGLGAYVQQAVVEDNIAVGNGGHGIESQSYTLNAASYGKKLIRNNTTWGNSVGTFASTALCAEIVSNEDYGVAITGNIAQTTATLGCPATSSSTNYQYAVSVFDGASTTSVSGNFLSAASGAPTSNYPSNDGFAFGTNFTTTNPGFSAPAVPGAPSCGSSASTVACMSGLISNFTASASGAAGDGYQPPSSVPVANANFPMWVCNTNLPSGLVSSPCGFPGVVTVVPAYAVVKVGSSLAFSATCTYPSGTATDNCAAAGGATLTSGRAPSGDATITAGTLTVNSTASDQEMVFVEATADGVSTTAQTRGTVQVQGANVTWDLYPTPNVSSFTQPLDPNTDYSGVVAGAKVAVGIGLIAHGQTGDGNPFNGCAWLSSNPSVAAFVDSGTNIVTALAPGTATLTCGGSTLTTIAAGNGAFGSSSQSGWTSPGTVIPIKVVAGGTSTQTWYVRPDGGTPYVSSSQTPSGQCDGKGDVAYSGSGVNQHCAMGQIEYLWLDQVTYGRVRWMIAGGDTVIVRQPTSSHPYYMGATSSGGQPNCPGDIYDCHMPPIPSGSATTAELAKAGLSGAGGHHTRILGENASDGLSTAVMLTDITGTSIDVNPLTGISRYLKRQYSRGEARSRSSAPTKTFNAFTDREHTVCRTSKDLPMDTQTAQCGGTGNYTNACTSAQSAGTGGRDVSTKCLDELCEPRRRHS